MNYVPPYPTPPPGYMPYDSYQQRNNAPMSPGPGYYSPRYGPQTATPSPRNSPNVKAHHSRRASHAVPPQHSYASPRGGAPSFMPDFQSPRFYATPQRTPEYVSGDFGYVRTGRPRRETDAPPLKRSHRERQRPSQSARHVHTKVVYDDYDPYVYDYGFDHVYDYPPPPYEPYARYETHRNADHYYYDQVPIYEQENKTSRPRRASHSTRTQPQATPKRPSAAAKSSAKATEEDARRAGIPAGYSYKNWDPTEEPIMLLGSVFDANSLGKWIYDWTVFHYGSATPLAEMAGELWLLLIQLAGKVKRAEEIMPKIRKQASREMVEDFLESGERLWIRFAKLLKMCEDYMWKAAKKETGEKKPVAMGKNSGCEFVNSIFGRDRELEKTEKLMTGMRLWSMRFDANCDEILRHPSA
ncbi:hypothetical protein CC80DRAFT_492459 [Byssothecium circinans]|uniref:Vegetative cell wall protein gp1 n=1 Tax=Byssothecium circinans TaxID=147558 RepID=A0A6A5U500_9PLEO|nr:hypothetical protein CC80DRAFT_492459 [Byssothecium circinans]